MSGSLVAILSGKIYGPNAFGQMLGINNTIISAAAIFAPAIIGSFFDSTGSYNTACAIIAALLALGFVCGMIAIKNGEKLQKKYSGT